jgi:S-phase kinase-associated protein 1
MASEQVELQACDGNLKVSVDLATVSATLRDLIEDAGIENPIPIPNITKDRLNRIFAFIAEHVEISKIPVDETAKKDEMEKPKKPWELEGWELNHVKDYTFEEVCHMLVATNYLDIQSFLNVLLKHGANQLKGKTPDQLCEFFGVKNDFTAEQLEEVAKENPWLEEY